MTLTLKWILAWWAAYYREHHLRWHLHRPDALGVHGWVTVALTLLLLAAYVLYWRWSVREERAACAERVVKLGESFGQAATQARNERLSDAWTATTPSDPTQ